MTLPTINWLRVISAVLSVIFISIIFYGAYQFYFNKPEPIINNHYVAMPNSNQTITQPNREFKQKNKFIGGGYTSKKDWLIIGGFLF